MAQEEDLLESLLAVATKELGKLDNDILDEKLETVKFLPNCSLTAEENLGSKIPKKQLKDHDIFQFESNQKLSCHKKPVSLIHSGDTDSSDDEGNRNYENQKYNQYGREIKSLLNSSHNSAFDTNSISSSHYGVPKKRVSTWKRNPNSDISNTVQPINNSSSIDTKKMFGKPPEAEKQFHDVFMDPIFGMRIVNPLISSSVLIERMQGRLAVRYSDLPRHLFAGNLKDKDWVICGVLVSKSPPKTSSKGIQYSIWTLSDLKDDIKIFSLFMFSNAHKDLWKTAVGTVVGVLNPRVMDAKDGKKEISLSVDNSQKIMVFGQSKDFGICKSMKKNGDKCTAVVNLTRCEYCIYHIKQEYQKCSKRSELQANFAGQGLINLRNKVLGKNEVFYAGKSYVAISAKKSKKLEVRDQNILQNLSGMNRSVKTKNVTKNIKGVARHLDVNPAQRARDLKLLEKLGGSTNLESKTNFSGIRSDEVTLEDSKATALSVINKLKASKSDTGKHVYKNSQFNLKNDLFVNVENKKTFSGNISEEVSLEDSKNKALATISKLKAKNKNSGDEIKKVQDLDYENLLTLEEIEDNLNFEDLNYSDDESKFVSLSDSVPCKSTLSTNKISPQDSLKDSSLNSSAVNECASSNSENDNCVKKFGDKIKSVKSTTESFGKMSPELSETKVNPNNSMRSVSTILATSKSTPGKDYKNEKRTLSGLKPNNLKEIFLNDLKASSPKVSVKSNSEIKGNECKTNARVSLGLSDSSSASISQCTNPYKSSLEMPGKSSKSLSSGQSDLSNMVMDIPMLSGFKTGDLIDLSKPITSRHINKAKVNAIKYIQRNGPIKKVDPNSTKNLSGKKRSIDSVLGLNNDSNNVNTNSVNEQSAAKKSKLQKSEFISDRFKKMMAMTSKYAGLLEQHDDEEKEKYFKKLEVKEKMEEKMTNTHKVKCKAVRCLQCKYTSFSASELCKKERHPLKVFDAMKRFYKCSNCQNRTVTLELIPTRPCNNCGSSKWEKTGMMKEKIALVCRKFNEVSSKLLSRGFIQLEKRHAIIYKRVKSALPRRESERKSHPLARHSDILQAVETRMSMLNMTYMRYIESRLICFVPGKVLDEIKSILDLVESNKTPPRTHQLLQELRDLSSMAMEHFDEHILPRCKEQLDQRTGTPEKILKELEVVADSLTPYPKFQDIYKNVASTSKSTRLLFNQQLPHALSSELYKVKKVTKSHKHHISYLTQNTQRLCLKVRRQANKLRIQTAKIREQERKIQEQSSKILEQEAALIDIKKHIDEWDQKYKDLTTELVRARDEILLKAATNSPIINSNLLSPPLLSGSDSQGPTFNILPLKSNIKPRAAHILPKSYISLDFERKRKSSLNAEIPIKRNRSPSAPITQDRQECSPKMGEDIQNLSLNVPDLKNFEKYESTIKDTDAVLAKAVKATNRFKSGSLTNALNNVKARKRKMADDIDLK